MFGKFVNHKIYIFKEITYVFKFNQFNWLTRQSKKKKYIFGAY